MNSKYKFVKADPLGFQLSTQEIQQMANIADEKAAVDSTLWNTVLVIAFRMIFLKDNTVPPNQLKSY